MKSLAKLKAEPGIWMYEAPMPQIGHNDVLIKIKKTSICGTDMHIYHWDEWAQQTVPVPLIIGHEFVGEVVDMGGEVEGFKIGDRVSGENHISCGHCRNCRAGRGHLCKADVSVGVTQTGCFAEYLALPAANAFPIPAEVTDDVGAILNPFGNSTHTALSFDLVGEDVLITGAGPVGIMACAVAKHVGARHVVITDINDYRLNLAQKLGATRVVNVLRENLDDVMHELNFTEGFDVGLEVSGNPNAFNAMLNAMIHGGHVALLGFLPHETQIDWNNIIMKGLIVKGVYGREMFETWYKMNTMIQSGLDISPVITHHVPVAEFEEAFKIMNSGQSGKIIIDWK